MAFLRIEPCYRCCDARTVADLGALYDEPERLSRCIRNVLGGRLPESEIRGRKILLKPNWVREESRAGDELCLRTNDRLLLGVLSEILLRRPREVLVGDAPIQGCDWDKMTSAIAPAIEEMSKHSGIPIRIRDFRRIVFNPRTNKFLDRTADMPPGLIFDLGRRSWLEPICDDRRKPFRILQYPSQFLAEHHHSGVHRYCITPEFFDYDVIITMPKIKTHEKVGMTNALKILVGINADKNYLPHHRLGGTGQGGDCYAGKNPLRSFGEWVFDVANHLIGTPLYRPAYLAGRVLWKLSRPRAEHPFSAGWYGNDTTWRMVMDLNLIAEYGQKDGSLASEKARKIYCFCDGIVAGQGNGPLRPEPAPLGVLMFSDCGAITDRAAAVLLGINAEKVPILKKLPFGENENDDISFAGRPVTLTELAREAISVRMPDGWIHYEQN